MFNNKLSLLQFHWIDCLHKLLQVSQFPSNLNLSVAGSTIVYHRIKRNITDHDCSYTITSNIVQALIIYQQDSGDFSVVLLALGTDDISR